MMKLLTPTFLALALASANSHAGFFDFLKPAQEEEPKVEVQKSMPAPAAATESAASTLDMASQGMDLAKTLIPQMSSDLSITEDQASGGLGSIMQYAQSTLSSEQGSQLASGIPGFDTLLAAAPALTGTGGVSSALGSLGSLGGSLGDAASALGGLDTLTKQFEALGLSPDMIGQMASMAMEFFSSESPATGDLLQQALSALTES